MTWDLYLRSHYNTAPFSHLLQQAVDLFGSSCYMYEIVLGFRGLIISPSLFIHLLQQTVDLFEPGSFKLQMDFTIC